MEHPTVIVSTHAPRQHLSRLGQFRLKDAKRRRDLAIAEAHDRYREDLRAIVNGDRAATLAQRSNARANYHYWPWKSWQNWSEPAQALAHPFMHALATGGIASWLLLDVAAFARSLRRG